MKTPALVGLPLLALVLTGCTVMPTGPSVMVLPGTGKSFDQFRVDDMNCRQFAFGQIGGMTANQAATNSAVSSAVVGTAVGALAGAAMGNSHDAAAGAGVGLLAGTAMGSANAQYSGYGTQRRYDTAYVQCMYASGHRVPVYGNMISAPPSGGYAPPPPPPGYRPG